MRVIIVDDDNLVTMSLKTILESDSNIEVIATGKNGYEAIELYEKYNPDILLMDIRMGEMDGIEAGEKIIKKYNDAKILYLTTFSDDDYIVRAIKLGAKGYILKQNYECIIPSINSVYLGQNVYGNEIINKLSMTNPAQAKQLYDFGLLDREIEVIEKVAEGLSNKEIAENLFLSEGTVRNYISTILEKLSLRDRTQLAIFYYRDIK
ncbi:DNA-binding NarL/FixJ family response regulator [Acetoanaerobium pronyense]|uniref:Stage 0 sporulation protein A homolog n=1 Tax=Acetoanaerobium pronyense TaxID=1482736 RepID=A0ABS4KHP7_9FIRM|nr:response regulator transcription factor [Acetoanaerobium pronyense]MBP2027290.1 DNA-binding NarL/FixJ family response regulator [Acetoanaerobium pronyense]